MLYNRILDLWHEYCIPACVAHTEIYVQELLSEAHQRLMVNTLVVTCTVFSGCSWRTACFVMKFEHV